MCFEVCTKGREWLVLLRRARRMRSKIRENSCDESLVMAHTVSGTVFDNKIKVTDVLEHLGHLNRFSREGCLEYRGKDYVHFS